MWSNIAVMNVTAEGINTRALLRFGYLLRLYAYTRFSLRSRLILPVLRFCSF